MPRRPRLGRLSVRPSVSPTVSPTVRQTGRGCTRRWAGLSFFINPSYRDCMPEVIIHDDESFERALKRFKKKCEKAGILSDLRKHRHYEKPSERRKRKMNAARRKNRRGGRPV
jgi:small subunit ribosomal protein S21